MSIAAGRGIWPLFVLFDSCWDPVPGSEFNAHRSRVCNNSAWVQSPGAERLDDPSYLRVMHDYVTGVMTQFRNDSRVLGWDLWNEPDNPQTLIGRSNEKTSPTSWRSCCLRSSNGANHQSRTTSDERRMAGQLVEPSAPQRDSHHSA